MNIVVKTAHQHVIVRPDTTWEKDNDDFYLPDFVTSLSYTPILFVRMSRPGRSIRKEFASRYYDSFNYGLLLYPDNLEDGSPEGFAAASCLDKTSFLPSPLYNMVVLGNEGTEFVLDINGKTCFKTETGSSEMLDALIEEVTSKVSVRTGDLVAIELAPRAALYDAAHPGEIHVHGTYCENETIDFNIIAE